LKEVNVLSLLVALYSVSAAQLPTPPDVVVIGQRITDAEDQLKNCLARHCRPDEDIDATLRLAETQLLAGKYRDARTTLLRSLSRNRDEAKAYPIPVSDLYRANGKVAANLGLDKDYYSSTFGIYRTLKYGLPPDDHRKYTAEMEIAEMMFRTRGHQRARYYYEKIAREARRDGRYDIAAIAELRSAIRHLPPGSAMQLNEINRIANLQGKTMEAPILQAKLALARNAYEKGDEKTAQAIQNELAKFDIKRPILIYSPSYEMVAREIDTGSEFSYGLAPPPPISGDGSSGGGGGGGLGPGALTSPPAGGNPNGLQGSTRGAITSTLALSRWSTTKRIPENYDDMWVDVAFRITTEGKVSDSKIVRSKGNLQWTRPLMASIAMRRYTAGKPGDPSSVRTERYTYTSGYEVQTASRTAQRSPKARVEFIDLSDVAAPD
jgi:hypothetical protein